MSTIYQSPISLSYTCSGKASHTRFNPLKLCRSANMWKGIKGKIKLCVHVSQIWLHSQDFVRGPDVEWNHLRVEGLSIWLSLLIYPNVSKFCTFSSYSRPQRYLRFKYCWKNVKPEWEIEILFSWTSKFWRAHQHFLTCFYLYKHMLPWVVVISSTQIGILTSALLTGCKWTVWEDLVLTELTVVLLTSV